MGQKILFYVIKLCMLYISAKTATLFYFYGPAAILLFSNLLMFIYTTVIIVKHMRNARVLNGSESNRTVDHEKQRWVPKAV